MQTKGITMLYILMGVVSATLFGILAVGVYGHDGLLDNLWVEYVFWWLIGTGVILALLENTFKLRCRPCRQTAATRAPCNGVPC